MSAFIAAAITISLLGAAVRWNWKLEQAELDEARSARRIRRELARRDIDRGLS